MALRQSSYSGTSSSINSFIKGLVNKKRAFEDSDMAYKYSRGQLTPEEYLAYIDKRLGSVSRSSTEFITWQKRRDSVVEDATDDRVRMQYESDMISPKQYAEYLKDEVLPRYKEDTNEYATVAMRVDSLFEEQRTNEEAAARKERSDYRMQKLYEISQMGDDTMAKSRAKMDMYQTLANEAAQDGDEAAYYRAATSYNNALNTYQNMAESASKSALAKEKKVYNEQISALDRELGRLIAANVRGPELNKVADAYLSKVLEAANSGSYDETLIDGLVTKINDMGYSGDVDANGRLVLGQYAGRYATRSGSPQRVIALEESRMGSPTPENKMLFGDTYFGNMQPLGGKSLAEQLAVLDAIAAQGSVKDEQGNEATANDYLGRSIRVYNGLTGQYEIRQIKEQDFANGVFDPKDIYIDDATGTAFKIQGMQIDPVTNLPLGSTKGSYIIIKNRDGRQVKIFFDDKGQLANTDDQSLLQQYKGDLNAMLQYESDYSLDLGDLGEGLVAEKKAEDERKRQEEMRKAEEEKARIASDKARMTVDQQAFEAREAANRPVMAAAPAAPKVSTQAYIDTRAKQNLPSSPKTNFAPFVGPNPASNPVNLLSPQKIYLTPDQRYYKVSKADGGYDFWKEGFGKVSVDDIAKETGKTRDYLLNK